MTIQKLKGNGRITFVVAHASTETRYTEKHTLVRFLLKFGDVCVFDLPGHGDERIEDGGVISTGDMLRRFTETMDTFPRPYIFIGYSLGALLGIKYLSTLEDTNYIALMIGAGLRVSEESAYRIRMFFDVRNFQAPSIAKSMEKRHGVHWEKLIVSVQNAIVGEENIMPTEEEITRIRQSPIYFLLAKKDQAYGTDQIPVEKDRIFIVDGNHFTYFHQKVAWDQTKDVLEQLIDIYSRNVGE